MDNEKAIAPDQKNISTKPTPFLRWAGGKTWILKELNDYLPKQGFNNYIEPFLGGGSVFFYLQPSQSYLSDINNELIDTYLAVQEDIMGVISELKKFKIDKESYYKIRSENYNSELKKAARFIYLNQTSFNGIYRVNKDGKYNVPFGRKIAFNFQGIINSSNALKNSSIKKRDFSDSLDDVSENDLVFLDPPYTVTHNNNGFIQYNSKIFNLDSQFRLSEFIDEIKIKGAYYILTNAAHPKIEEIFYKEDDRKYYKSRHSLVGGKGSARGMYKEVIFTNIYG